jgi:hypothetical protein
MSQSNSNVRTLELVGARAATKPNFESPLDVTLRPH